MSLELERALAEIPILDIHTHLVGGRLAARGLHDVLLYHMVVSDLYAAGAPAVRGSPSFPGGRAQDEAAGRIEEALPYLRHIQNTQLVLGRADHPARALRVDRRRSIESNWKKLDGLIRERADDRSWAHQVLDRSRIERTGTELARRGDGSGRRPPAICAGMGLLYPVPVGRIRYRTV